MTTQATSLNRLPDAVFRNRKTLLYSFFGILLITALVTFLMKKQYQSEMKVEVQNSRETQVVSSESNTQQGQGVSEDLIESHVNSEVELLTSTDILQHLVIFRDKAIGGVPVPEVGSEDMAKELKKLLKHLDIIPVRKSAIIDVTYTDESPEVAQAVLKELQHEYLKKHVLLQRPEGTSNFFNSETDAVTKRRQQAEVALSTFQASNGFVSMQKEKELLADNFDRAKSAVLEDSVELSAARREVDDLKQRLAATPQRITTVQRSIPNQLVTQQLTAQLTDLQNRRIALAQRYVSTDRLMVEVDAQIKSTKSALDYLVENNAQEKTDDNDPAWLAMDLSYKTKQVALAGINSRLAEHRNQAATYEARLLHLQEITPENNALEQKVQELRDNQHTLIGKRDAAMVDDMLDANRFGNVGIALQPTFSRMYVKPIPLLNAVLGLLTAIVFCVALVMVLESTRRTMFTPAELELNAGIPVLATVPNFHDVNKLIAQDHGAFRLATQS
jgi:succinoglycan biosynthesis transport protein ExoP